MVQEEDGEMNQRQGPERTVKVRFSCYRCQYNDSERYVHQSDSGFDYFCTFDGQRRVVPDHYDTPSWCPFRHPGDDEVVEAGHCADCDNSIQYSGDLSYCTELVNDGGEVLPSFGCLGFKRREAK
jgi:hypothetical protein